MTPPFGACKAPAAPPAMVAASNSARGSLAEPMTAWLFSGGEIDADGFAAEAGASADLALATVAVDCVEYREAESVEVTDPGLGWLSIALVPFDARRRRGQLLASAVDTGAGALPPVINVGRVDAARAAPVAFGGLAWPPPALGTPSACFCATDPTSAGGVSEDAGAGRWVD